MKLWSAGITLYSSFSFTVRQAMAANSQQSPVNSRSMSHKHKALQLSHIKVVLQHGTNSTRDLFVGLRITLSHSCWAFSQLQFLIWVYCYWYSAAMSPQDSFWACRTRKTVFMSDPFIRKCTIFIWTSILKGSVCAPRRVKIQMNLKGHSVLH